MQKLLVTIDSSQRDRVREYQRRCEEALTDVLLKGAAPPVSQPKHTPPSSSSSFTCTCTLCHSTLPLALPFPDSWPERGIQACSLVSACLHDSDMSSYVAVMVLMTSRSHNTPEFRGPRLLAMCAGAATYMCLLGANIRCGRHAASVLQGSVPAELPWLKGPSQALTRLVNYASSSYHDSPSGPDPCVT